MVTGANSTGALTGAGDYNIVGTTGVGLQRRVQTITAASTNSGQTIVGDGTAAHQVTLTASGSFLSSASATGVTQFSTLDLGGFNQTVSSLNYGGAASGGTVTNNGGADATLTNISCPLDLLSGVIQDRVRTRPAYDKTPPARR